MDREIRRIVREDEALGRLMTIPGVGELTAMAVHTYAPPMESFRNGRDFAAWVGLTPREFSTGGRQRLGRITEMGQRRHPEAPVPGGDGGHLECHPAGGGHRSLAWPDAGREAEEGGCGGSGQQDGTHHLGRDGEGGELQGTGSDKGR